MNKDIKGFKLCRRYRLHCNRILHSVTLYSRASIETDLKPCKSQIPSCDTIVTNASRPLHDCHDSNLTVFFLILQPWDKPKGWRQLQFTAFYYDVLVWGLLVHQVQGGEFVGPAVGNDTLLCNVFVVGKIIMQFLSRLGDKN